MMKGKKKIDFKTFKYCLFNRGGIAASFPSSAFGLSCDAPGLGFGKTNANERRFAASNSATGWSPANFASEWVPRRVFARLSGDIIVTVWMQPGGVSLEQGRQASLEKQNRPVFRNKRRKNSRLYEEGIMNEWIRAGFSEHGSTTND